MIISLIGMSGTGKSHWSQKLVRHGFKRYCCDDLIEEKLSHVLKAKGYSGIADVARWMGQPYDTQYPQTSREYLELEIDVMEDIFKRLAYASVRDNIVIDTTGSMIYVPSDIIAQVRKCSTIVYLETPISVRQQMFERYMRDPKPVIWGDIFTKKPNDNNLDAIARCYPKLLEYRSHKYETIADFVVKHNVHTDTSFTPERLMEHVHSYNSQNTCFYDYHEMDKYTGAMSAY